MWGVEAKLHTEQRFGQLHAPTSFLTGYNKASLRIKAKHSIKSVIKMASNPDTSKNSFSPKY
jgi:hypothetical protein